MRCFLLQPLAGSNPSRFKCPRCKVPIYRFMVTQLATLDNIFRLLTHAPIPFRNAGQWHLISATYRRAGLASPAWVQPKIWSNPPEKKPFQFWASVYCFSWDQNIVCPTNIHIQSNSLLRTGFFHAPKPLLPHLRHAQGFTDAFA